MSNSSFDPVTITTNSKFKMLEVSDGVYLQGKELEDHCHKRGLCTKCAKVKVRRRVVKVFGANTWEPITAVKVPNNGPSKGHLFKQKSNNATKKKTKNYMTVKAKIESGEDDNVEYLVYKGYCLTDGCYTLEQAKRLSGLGIGIENSSLGSSQSLSSSQSNTQKSSHKKRGKLLGSFRRRPSAKSTPSTTLWVNPNLNNHSSLFSVGENSSDVHPKVEETPYVMSPMLGMVQDEVPTTTIAQEEANNISSHISEPPLAQPPQTPQTPQQPLDNSQFTTPERNNTTKINTDIHNTTASSEDLSVVPSPQVRKTHEHEFSWGSRGSPKKRYNNSRDLYQVGSPERDESPRTQPVRQIVQETISALQGLSAVPSIRTLDLSGLKLRVSEMEALAKLFKAGKNGTVHLKSLILNNCGVDDGLTEILAQALYDALFTANNRIGAVSNPNSNGAKLSKSMRHARMRLTLLDLGDNDISDKGIESLCLYLESISCELEHLDLSRNSIETSGGVAIFDALKRNPQTKIESIDLSCNLLRELEFSDKGQTQKQQQQQQYSYSPGIPGRSSGIHGFLSKNKTLKELDLSANRMTDEWVEALCRGLSLNAKSALEHLSLGFNRIGNRGAVAIGMCLTVNKSLVLLELNDNHIENDGAQALLEAMEDNTTIKDIAGLWSNKIDKRHIIVSIRQLLVSDTRKKQISSANPTNKNGPPNGDFSDDDSDDIYITSDSEGAAIPPPLSNSSEHTPRVRNTVDNMKLLDDDDSSNPLEEGFLGDENDSDFLSVQDKGDVSDLSEQDDDDDLSDLSESYNVLLQQNVEGKGMEGSDDMMETNQEVTHNMFDRMTIMNSSPLVCFDDDTENSHQRGISLLDTLQETEAIKAAVEVHHATKGSSIEVQEEMATLEKFKAFFSARESTVLHLSCHAFQDGLALENGYGSLEKLSLSGLKTLISGCAGKSTLELVFVSSPSALQIGRAFVEAGVKHVVCCQRKDTFRDPIAMKFMESFYELASQKKSLSESFKAALRIVVSSPLAKNASLVTNRFHLLPSQHPSSSPVFFQRMVPKTTSADLDESLKVRLELQQWYDILPPLPDYFLGREVEIFKILEALQVSDCVEVSGSSGYGKESIIGASLQYAIKRSETFLIEQVCWIPAPKNAMVDPDSLYGDMILCCDLIRDSRKDLWDRSEEVLDCRERLSIELEGAKVAVVIDNRRFKSRASRSALQKLINFIVTSSSSAKVICITSSSAPAVNETNDSDDSAIKTNIIQIDALPFRSTARLFGEASEHVSRNSESTIAWSGTEFSQLADIPFVSHTKDSSSDGTTSRRTEILDRIGNGLPAQVIASANNMTRTDFDFLMKIILTPEIGIDSVGELENEVRRRNAFMEQAIKDGNYKRAVDLEATINELDGMKFQFSSLKDLKAKEKSMKSELADAISNRRYDVANELKRELLVLKKKIMKERRASTNRSGEKPNGVLSDLKFQVDSLAKTLEHDESAISKEETKFFRVDCDGHTCAFLIYSGNTFDAKSLPAIIEPMEQWKSKGIGIVCWSNEACDLEGNLGGKSLLGANVGKFKKCVANLPTAKETRHGSVRCLMGNSVVLDPRSSSSTTDADTDNHEESVGILTVGPFSSPSGQIDALLEQDEEFRRHGLTTLRCCYRACLQQTERVKLRSLAVCPLTTRAKNGPLYEESLRVAVREIVEEAKFSKGLQEVRLIGKTPKEAALLVGIMKAMGYSLKK